MGDGFHLSFPLFSSRPAFWCRMDGVIGLCLRKTRCESSRLTQVKSLIESDFLAHLLLHELRKFESSQKMLLELSNMSTLQHIMKLNLNYFPHISNMSTWVNLGQVMLSNHQSSVTWHSFRTDTNGLCTRRPPSICCPSCHCRRRC